MPRPGSGDQGLLAVLRELSGPLVGLGRGDLVAVADDRRQRDEVLGIALEDELLVLDLLLDRGVAARAAVSAAEDVRDPAGRPAAHAEPDEAHAQQYRQGGVGDLNRAPPLAP